MLRQIYSIRGGCQDFDRPTDVDLSLQHVATYGMPVVDTLDEVLHRISPPLMHPLNPWCCWTLFFLLDHVVYGIDALLRCSSFKGLVRSGGGIGFFSRPSGEVTDLGPTPSGSDLIWTRTKPYVLVRARILILIGLGTCQTYRSYIACAFTGWLAQRHKHIKINTPRSSSPPLRSCSSPATAVFGVSGTRAPHLVNGVSYQQKPI